MNLGLRVFVRRTFASPDRRPGQASRLRVRQFAPSRGGVDGAGNRLRVAVK